ncbi:hypothetical protein B0H12DRAFT_1070017 [Mycena haematopus]|nr:hypothetical protein B0H12DRAFT_1074693 [Mycena haematopus]KAJ7259606.1 hypothetical protein B0H12DRAFT_1070017 [Mycena haematopus]
MGTEMTSADRELKMRALQDIRYNSPHTELTQRWLTQHSLPSPLSTPPSTRSAAEIEKGREDQKARIEQRRVEREAETAATEALAEAPRGRSKEEIQRSRDDLYQRVEARKKRRDHLDQLRNAPPRGPKLPHMLTARSPEEVKRQALEEIEKKEEKRLRERRVEHLLAMRASTSKHAKSPHVQPGVLSTPHLSFRPDFGRHRVQTAGNLVADAIPDDTLDEILQISDARTTATLVLVSRKFAAVARPRLYRNIDVPFCNALQLFRTLAAKPAFGEWVLALEIRGHSSRLQGTDFEAAMGTLLNLRCLHIRCDLDRVAFNRSFRAQLHEFSYGPSVDDLIMDFLMLQKDIQWVYFRNLNLLYCDPSFLPRLERVHAHPEDMAILVPSRPVTEVQFVYDPSDYEDRPVIPLDFITLSTTRVVCVGLQLSQLVDAVPVHSDLAALLPWVERLIIYQDVTWGHSLPVNTFFFGGAFIDVIDRPIFRSWSTI